MGLLEQVENSLAPKKVSIIDFATSSDFCNPPDAPIWMADLSFKKIGDIRVGDCVMGWNRPDVLKVLCESVVTAVKQRYAPVVKVTMESGRTFRCTPDHLWLTASFGTGERGKHKYEEQDKQWFMPATPNRNLVHVIDPTPALQEDQIRTATWLGGIFDGEGSGGKNAAITIGQYESSNPEVCRAIETSLDRLGFKWSRSETAFLLRASNGSTKEIGSNRKSRQMITDFANWCQPFRRQKLIDKVIGTAHWATKDRVLSVESDGEEEVIALTTSTGNYICNGYASKNCNKALYPRQEVFLKLINLEELSGYEEDVLDDWIAGGKWGNEVRISPNIRERVEWLRENEYPHFQEVVMVGGRRSSKGFCTGIQMAYIMWSTLQLQDPGSHYGIDPEKDIYFSCVAGSEDQAKEFQFADFQSTVTTCKAFDPYIIKSLETELRIATETDLRRIQAEKARGNRIQKDIARLRGKALAANAGTLRGSATMVVAIDEMAHMIPGESKASADKVYDAAMPSLDQFGVDGMAFCNSSPYSKVGMFFDRHEAAMVPFDPSRPLDDVMIAGEDSDIDLKSLNGNPRIMTFQYPSWAQPLHSGVLTPSGWKLMGEIVTGDWIIGSSGNRIKVLGTRRLNDEVYRVHFSDGQFVECSKDHLWEIRNSVNEKKILRTVEIQRRLSRLDTNHHYLPELSPVQFMNQESIPVPPYVLGVLLGDGCMASNTTSYYSNEFKDALRDIGVLGCVGDQKHIPDLYQRSSIQNRFSLLQGLLDTDGEMVKNKNSIIFYNSSRQLVDDVRELVELLGGVTKIYVDQRKERPAYRVSIKLPVELGCPFRMAAKAQHWEPQRYRPRRKIVSIEMIRREDVQCLSVDSDDGLYVTDHGVLTHNSLFQDYQKSKHKHRLKWVLTASPDWDEEELDENGDPLWNDKDKTAIKAARAKEKENPEAYKVERRGKFAEVSEAYMIGSKVDAMFKGIPIEWVYNRDRHTGEMEPIPVPVYAALATNDSGKLKDYGRHKFHIDPSSTTAGFGFAIAHTENISNFEGVEEEHVVFDLIKRWKPQDFPGKVIRWEIVLPEILWYAEIFRPFEITFGAHESLQAQQELEEKLRAKNFSTRVYQSKETAELNWKRWEMTKTSIYAGLVHAPCDTPDAEFACLELKFLQQKTGTGRYPRIDKQELGPVQTKDMADSLAECVSALIGNQIANRSRERLSHSALLGGSPGGYAIGLGSNPPQGGLGPPGISEYYSRRGEREAREQTNPARGVLGGGRARRGRNRARGY